MVIQSFEAIDIRNQENFQYVSSVCVFAPLVCFVSTF